MSAKTTTTREDYGIDAPTVVRNLAVIGAILVVANIAAMLLWPSDVRDENDILHLLRAFLPTGVACLVMTCFMLVSSKVLKHRVAKALLDERQWRGDEKVLDVGCGRGLVAIAAARRVPNGHVTGVDIWQQRDLSGNGPDAMRKNAEAAGVATRVAIDTGDARSLPYPDDTFDVVASMTAIHNIPKAAGRAAAVAEVWRVTKPGGQILVYDVIHARKYAAQLRAAGAIDVRLVGPVFLWFGRRFSATKPC